MSKLTVQEMAEACAREETASRLEDMLGSENFQLGPKSPVEFVEHGAWVTVRIWSPNL